MIAASSSITAQMDMKMHVFTISFLPLCCIIRQVNHVLAANATEYARNSSQVNGNANKKRKTKRGGTP